jgi:hypothetical protein
MDYLKKQNRQKSGKQGKLERTTMGNGAKLSTSQGKDKTALLNEKTGFLAEKGNKCRMGRGGAWKSKN